MQATESNVGVVDTDNTRGFRRSELPDLTVSAVGMHVACDGSIQSLQHSLCVQQARVRGTCFLIVTV